MENNQSINLYYVCLVSTLLDAAGQLGIPKNSLPNMDKNALITFARAQELVPKISGIYFRHSSAFKKLITPANPCINVYVGSESYLVQMRDAKEIQKWFRCLFLYNNGPPDEILFCLPKQPPP